jgi:hypothetical protein
VFLSEREPHRTVAVVARDGNRACASPGEAGVGQPETDGGEDPVAVAAQGAGEFDERFEL